MKALWQLTGPETATGQLAQGETVHQLFWDAAARRGDKVWLRQKDRGFWREWTWSRFATGVREVACGLADLAVQPGEVCSVLSNTNLEWLMADLGILSCGGVSSGIYPTDSPEQVQYLSTDSATVVLFVENDEQLDKVLSVRDHLPLLRWIVIFDMEGLHHFSDPRVMSLDQLRERGCRYDLAHPGEFERRLRSRQPADLALLVYTSGTTGRAKGAMHSHQALIYSANRYNAALPQYEDDERMCFLPLCHLAERLLGAYVAILTGAKLNFVENPDTIPENVREIAPTCFLAVPRIWEKFYSHVVMSINEATWLQQATYAWSIGVGQRVADRVVAGKAVQPHLKLMFWLALLVCLGNVRKMIGIHRARRLQSGAAPIAPDLIRWYLSLGVPMLEGWAQTECLLGTFTRPERIKPGTIGTPIDGVDVKIAEKTGELMLRGPSVFMGYLNQPQSSAAAIGQDGWLHTGDVGEVDGDGFYRITDRMKDIIITAGGKNITPSEIENELKFSPYVTDAVVIGDRRPYLTAIIMIDLENVERYAQDNNVAFSNYASLTRAPEIISLIDTEVQRVNAKMARVEQIKKFMLLEKQLNAEDEELTPTMKLKRKLVEQRYADRINQMYQ